MDPRFYCFVKTPVGRVLSTVFRWQAGTLQPVDALKPESDMTKAELGVKRHLEEQVRAEWPTHRIVFKSGRFLEGYIRDKNEKKVLFAESYGQSGEFSTWIALDSVERIESISPESCPPITYRDVRFQMEYPAMTLHKRPPYSVLTDESFFLVERTTHLLRELHNAFIERFGPLMSRQAAHKNIQILFFSREAPYVAYLREYAPHMEGSQGFYSPALDRLIVFNEKGSDQTQEMATTLERSILRAQQRNTSEAFKSQAEAWKQRVERNINHEAEKRTYTTIRHEGAHQLFNTYGIHSSCHLENEWLIEGLAVYCETRHMGDKDPYRVNLLQKAMSDNQLIPLSDLLAFRNPKGFLALGDSRQIDLAYSEAWAMISMLMQPEYINNFFEYMRYIGNTTHIRDALRQSRIDVLSRFIGIPADQLEAQWRMYIKNM